MMIRAFTDCKTAALACLSCKNNNNKKTQKRKASDPESKVGVKAHDLSLMPDLHSYRFKALPCRGNRIYRGDVRPKNLSLNISS